MSSVVSVMTEKGYMGRAEHGADLLDELTDFCADQQITLGRVEAIGALQEARLGYYKQKEKEYEYVTLNQSVEITGLIGNISLKGGNPIVHVHLTVTDENGKAYGGHLATGCVVFACEFLVMKFSGEELARSFDKTTGLPLWNMNSTQ